jgi:3-oxoadipate enol-lactonase
VTICELHFELAGDSESPPLVLGGSLGTTLAMWDPQIGPLSTRWRTICFDHRGHGGSPVPNGPYEIDDLGRDGLALLDRLAIDRASYCGLSLGGMVGMWLAAKAPERIDRLVLICTSAHLPPGSGYAERAALVRAAGTPEVVADAVLERWFTRDYAAQHPHIAAHHRAMIAATPAEGYAGCCEAIAALDLRPDLPRIAAPTVVIAGAEDPATPLVHAQAIAGEIPSARLCVLDGAAHLASAQQADAVTRLIADHLDSRRQT